MRKRAVLQTMQNSHSIPSWDDFAIGRKLFLTAVPDQHISLNMKYDHTLNFFLANVNSATVLVSFL